MAKGSPSSSQHKQDNARILYRARSAWKQFWHQANDLPKALAHSVLFLTCLLGIVMFWDYGYLDSWHNVLTLVLAAATALLVWTRKFITRNIARLTVPLIIILITGLTYYVLLPPIKYEIHVTDPAGTALSEPVTLALQDSPYEIKTNNDGFGKLGLPGLHWKCFVISSAYTEKEPLTLAQSKYSSVFGWRHRWSPMTVIVNKVPRKPTSREALDRLKREGIDFMNRGRYTDAIGRFKAILNSPEGDPLLKTEMENLLRRCQTMRSERQR